MLVPLSPLATATTSAPSTGSPSLHPSSSSPSPASSSSSAPPRRSLRALPFPFSPLPGAHLSLLRLCRLQLHPSWLVGCAPPPCAYLYGSSKSLTRGEGFALGCGGQGLARLAVNATFCPHPMHGKILRMMRPPLLAHTHMHTHTHAHTHGPVPAADAVPFKAAAGGGAAAAAWGEANEGERKDGPLNTPLEAHLDTPLDEYRDHASQDEDDPGHQQQLQRQHQEEKQQQQQPPPPLSLSSLWPRQGLHVPRPPKRSMASAEADLSSNASAAASKVAKAAAAARVRAMYSRSFLIYSPSPASASALVTAGAAAAADSAGARALLRPTGDARRWAGSIVSLRLARRVLALTIEYVYILALLLHDAVFDYGCLLPMMFYLNTSRSPHPPLHSSLPDSLRPPAPVLWASPWVQAAPRCCGRPPLPVRPWARQRWPLKRHRDW